MTKQEIMEDYANFMATSLESKRFGLGEEACVMLDAYLYGMVLVYLRPEWFSYEKHKPAYEALLDQFFKYRQKTGRTAEYNSFARTSGLLPEPPEGSIYGDVDGDHIEMIHSLACPADLGLMVSEDPKDRKFCRKAIAQYIRKGFNRHAAAPVALKAKPKIDAAKIAEDLPFDLPPLNREARRALEKGQLPCPIQNLLSQPRSFNIKPPELPVKSEQNEVAEIKTKFIDEMHRYVIMLAGRIGAYALVEDEADWDYVELDTGEEVLNLDSRYAREAACLRPTGDACAFCQSEFRRLLATIYYVRENKLPVEPLFRSGGAERESYFRAAEAVVLPLLELVDDQVELEHATTGAVVMDAKSCLDELDAANQQIQDLQARLDEAAKQVDYITGYHPNKKNRAGMFMHVYLVAPAGGTISNITTEGGDFSPQPFTEMPYNQWTFFTASPVLAGGETITISYDVTVSAEAEQPLMVRTTPTAQVVAGWGANEADPQPEAAE